MNTAPHWTAYLAALLTPVVAILGAYIAWRQARIAQNKLKLDLFDRRFSVYDSARALLAEVMTQGKVSDEALYKFGGGTRQARWLLDASIAEYFQKELWKNAVHLQTFDDELQGIAIGEERNAMVQKRADLKKWFYAKHDILDSKFEPFLGLKH